MRSCRAERHQILVPHWCWQLMDGIMELAMLAEPIVLCVVAYLKCVDNFVASFFLLI